MTDAPINMQRKRRVTACREAFIASLMLAATLLISIKLSDEIAELAKEGMRVAVTLVLPSAFPFMIISDLYAVYGYPERLRPLCFLMERVFGISRCGTRAYVTGNLSGFPIGARATAELYKNGEIKKNEAERLLVLSNTPSPSFVLGAVGYGMLGSENAGLLILFTLLIAQIAVGILTKRKTNFSKKPSVNIRQRFDFVKSVKNAGINSISICAFVVFFNCALGVVKALCPFSVLTSMLTATLEVTGAVRFFASCATLSTPLKYGAICFSLGFGGLSVMLQSMIFLEETDLSFWKLLAGKLFNGMIAFAVGVALALALPV